MTENSANNKIKLWSDVGIIISWATFWIILLSPFGLLAWIGILIYLIVKKAKIKRYLLLSAWLFVPSCSFITGTVRYCTGTATLQGIGVPLTDHGIDRETRVPKGSSGCLFLGFEPFVFPANNAAVRLWTNIFGFQTGSYKGAFPTEEEAKKMIKSANTLDVKHLDNCLQFNISGQNIKIDTSEFYNESNPISTFNKALGLTIKNECLIFQRLKEGNNKKKELIYIVDISKNSILKTYFYD